ncbi:hypothetical protein TWF718_010704 [Orbilia javanica]|uniref:Uncharacterized protein n=1 Tax=Orbilia javanica TaxID=47235 RepID=A0AAN8MPM2_9PEZI
MKSIAPVFFSLVAISNSVYAQAYDPTITDGGCPGKYDPNCPYYCGSRGQGSFCSPNFITGPGTPGCFVCPGIPSECPSTPNGSCAYICTGTENINLGPGSPNVFCAPSDASLGPFEGKMLITCVPCTEDDGPIISPPEDTPTPQSEGTSTPTPTPTPEDTPTTSSPSEETPTAYPPEDTTTPIAPPPSNNTTMATTTIATPPPSQNTTTPTTPPPSLNTTFPPLPEYTGAASRNSIGGAVVLGLAIVLFNL